MTTNFDSVQTLKSSEDCYKFSKSVSYETLVAGTTTTGTGIKQTRRFSKGSADKPLSAVGTLTSLLCNSAKVMEKLLYRHSKPKAKNPKKTEKALSLSGASSEPIISAESKRDPRLIAMQSPRMTEKVLSFLRLRGASGAQGISAPASCLEAHKRRFILNQLLLHFANTSLRMTIPTLAFLLSLNLSTAFAEITCTMDGAKLTIGGSGTFYGCPGILQRHATEVTIGTGVTSIGQWAFEDVKNLTSITIPDSVTSIGDWAFKNAIGLTSIKIQEGVTIIGSGAFEGASSLESITIPDSVKSIGGSAFKNASSLKSIIIPDNINTANWSAAVFAVLPADTKIVCQGDVEKCKKALAKFGGTGKCTVLYCINSDLIVAADESQCTSTNYYWSGSSCNNKKNGIICAEKWKRNEDFCNRIQYTPSEAAKVLNDDNTNSVTITFKK